MLSRAQNLSHLKLAILILAIPLAGCRDRDSAEELYEQAERAQQGKDSVVAEELAREGLLLASDPNTALHWKFKIILSEALIQKRDSKGTLELLSEEMPERPDFQVFRCMQSMNQARALLQRRKSGDLEISSDLLKESWQRASRLNSAPLLARIQLRKGYQAFWEAQDLEGQRRQERLSESEEFFRDATKRAEALGDPDLQATSSGSLSFFLTETLRHSEAIEQYQISLQLAKRAGNRNTEQKTTGNMGWSYYWLGDLQQAKQLLSKAEEMAGSLGILTDRHRWVGDLGAVYYAEKNYLEAIDRFQEAYEISNQLPEKKSLWVARWLHNLSTASLRLNRLEQAEQYNRQARELKESLEESERRDSMLYTLLGSADILISKQEFGEAEKLLLEMLQSGADDPTPLWEARATLGGLYARLNKVNEAERHFEEALQSFEEVRVRLKHDSGLTIMFQERRVEYLQSYVDFLMQNGDFEQALEVVESSRAQVLAEGLGRDPAENGQAVSFQRIARDLDAVLLSYWIAPRRSYAWAVTPDGQIQAFNLPGQEQVERVVNSYAEIIQVRDPIKTNKLSGSRIYRTLLQPMQDILRAEDQVVLVPHGVLHNLNFETIPIPEPEPHYWIEDVTLALAPSLALIQPRQDEPGNRQASAFLIGFSPQGDPLPSVEKEIDMIGKLLERNGMKSESLMQAQASASIFQSQRILDSPLIHFGAHAVANRESPLNSYVILSDKLYAHSVASTKLNVRLVTVSACQSAGAHSYVGEGLVGFTWAFFYAGAHNVVAGLWNVNDRSSSKLMQEFYANLATGMDIARALRQAKLTMLASNGPQSRPYHWAPFQIYTHSSPFQSLLDPALQIENAETNGN